MQPPGRFGALDVDGERVSGFEEKPRGDGGWTNGGFFVLSPGVARYLDGDDDRVGAGADARAGARRPARRLSATRASGRRWTRCATATSSRSCGTRGRAVADMASTVSLAVSAAASRGAVDPGFWRERRVLLTGHTGFKGAWLSLWLQSLGAR